MNYKTRAAIVTITFPYSEPISYNIIRLYYVLILPVLTDEHCYLYIPFMPTGSFNICCPRDCVSHH